MGKTENGVENKESGLMFKEISPPHRWDQDLDFHYLRLTVPGKTLYLHQYIINLLCFFLLFDKFLLFVDLN